MSLKIRKFSCLLSYAFLIILLVSCGTEIEQFTPNESTGLVDDIYLNFTTETELFDLDLQDQLIIETKRGSVILIEKSTLDFGAVIPDNISIKIKEVSDKAGMIKNNLSTTTLSKLLISERMLKVTLESEGSPINLKDGETFKVFIPNTQPKDKMKLFYGNADFETIIWEEAENDEALIINEWFLQTPNGVLADYGYILNCDRFDWINVDVYYETPEDQKIDVSIELPNVLYNGDNTMAFMVFVNENSAVRLSYDAENHRFYEPYGATPKGYDIKIVMLSSISEEEFHFGLKTLNTENNIRSFMIPEPMEKSVIEEKLKAL